ncbi:MAG TPA: hypothetical protein VEU33_49420 [Archangium sp.]|nr:hypothetical protein [Archangium sp.]
MLEHPSLRLCMIALAGGLVSGCAMAMVCRPGDSTVDCCIKKHPLSPMEHCTATIADVNRVLREIAETSIAVANANDDFNPDDYVDSDEFANNQDLPAWKQRCIKFYVACIERRWTGNCYDCIRYCEGQQKWPRDECHPPGEGS